MQNIFPSPIEARDFVSNPMSSSNAFYSSVASTIMTDMAAGKRVSNIDINGKSTNDIRYVLGTLNQMGYKAQIVANKILQVNW